MLRAFDTLLLVVGAFIATVVVAVVVVAVVVIVPTVVATVVAMTAVRADTGTIKTVVRLGTCPLLQISRHTSDDSTL